MLSGKGKKGHFNEIFHRPCSLFACDKNLSFVSGSEEGRKRFFRRRLTWQLIKLDISFTVVVDVPSEFKGFRMRCSRVEAVVMECL